MDSAEPGREPGRFGEQRDGDEDREGFAENVGAIGDLSMGAVTLLMQFGREQQSGRENGVLEQPGEVGWKVGGPAVRNGRYRPCLPPGPGARATRSVGELALGAQSEKE